ncbi:hypothetical protein C7M84_013847 [Penaeus vannamei]|uniref:Uncharacterized protein n=1 Tax=Penaeus vannamei TaxID=6689 RepID=A0A3R7MRL3_PENVA|nr:hypothetical protein C7M84_013847 [Penaeus vannamei]
MSVCTSEMHVRVRPREGVSRSLHQGHLRHGLTVVDAGYKAGAGTGETRLVSFSLRPATRREGSGRLSARSMLWAGFVSLAALSVGAGAASDRVAARACFHHPNNGGTIYDFNELDLFETRNGEVSPRACMGVPLPPLVVQSFRTPLQDSL